VTLATLAPLRGALDGGNSKFQMQKNNPGAHGKTAQNRVSAIQEHCEAGSSFEVESAFVDRLVWGLNRAAGPDGALRPVFDGLLCGSGLSCREAVQLMLDTLAKNGHDWPVEGRTAGVALGGDSSFMNHSCWPNCDARPVTQRCFEVRAIRDVRAGEEMTISYTDLWRFAVDRRARLGRVFGFYCACERCVEAEPDSGEPDSGEPDSGEPDSGEPDSGEPDSGEPEPLSGSGEPEPLSGSGTKSPAGSELDRLPPLLSGTGRSGDAEFHERELKTKLDAVRRDWEAQVARGRSRRFEAEALRRSASWLREAERTLSPLHPLRATGLRWAADRAMEAGRPAQALDALDALAEACARVLPRFWFEPCDVALKRAACAALCGDAEKAGAAFSEFSEADRVLHRGARGFEHRDREPARLVGAMLERVNERAAAGDARAEAQSRAWTARACGVEGAVERAAAAIGAGAAVDPRGPNP
jgi:hypothetical protein